MLQCIIFSDTNHVCKWFEYVTIDFLLSTCLQSYRHLNMIMPCREGYPNACSTLFGNTLFFSLHGFFIVGYFDCSARARLALWKEVVTIRSICIRFWFWMKETKQKFIEFGGGSRVVGNDRVCTALMIHWGFGCTLIMCLVSI